MSTQHREGSCPVCQNDMKVTGATQYSCAHCDDDYVEHAFCPTCGGSAERLQACGAVNYLCLKDGLLSKSKVEYRYLLDK